jgi:hypothetical protein
VTSVRTRIAAPATGASLVLLAGCGGQIGAANEPVPNELHTREAYLDTPLITDDSANAIPLRTTRAAVAGRIGRSHVGYRRAGRECRLYPIAGTQRRDAFGSPLADEWEFCFDAAGRLAVKTRIRNPRRPA